MALEIREESIGATRLLLLSGRLDTETSSDLELAAQDLMQAGERNFLLDLSGIGYVSSSGLRVLLMLAKSVDGNGSLRLAGLNPTVRQVFDVAGFTPLFSIFADRAAALANLPPGPVATASSVSAAEPQVATTPAPDLATVAAQLLKGSAASDGVAKASPDLVDRVAQALGANGKR